MRLSAFLCIILVSAIAILNKKIDRIKEDMDSLNEIIGDADILRELINERLWHNRQAKEELITVNSLWRNRRVHEECWHNELGERKCGQHILY